MCLGGGRVLGSAIDDAVVVGIAAGVVGRVTVVVPAVVEVFGGMNGLLSLLSILSLSLPPNCLFQGILP